MAPPRFFRVLVVGLFLFIPISMAAVTYTLISPSGGFWSDTTIWSPSGYPSYGDTAILNQPGATVTLDRNTTIHGLQVSQDAILVIPGPYRLNLFGTGEIAEGGEIQVINNGVLNGNDNLTVRGFLTLNNGSAWLVRLADGSIRPQGNVDSLSYTGISSNGDVNWTGDTLYVQGTNLGLFYLHGRVLHIPGWSITFHNRGRIVKAMGPDSVVIYPYGEFSMDSLSSLWVQQGKVVIHQLTATACTLRLGLSPLDQQPSPQIVFPNANRLSVFEDVRFTGNGEVVLNAWNAFRGETRIGANTQFLNQDYLNIDGPLDVVRVDGTLLGGDIVGNGQLFIENGGVFRPGYGGDTSDVSVPIIIEPYGSMIYTEGLFRLNSSDSVVVNGYGHFTIEDSAIVGHRLGRVGSIYYYPIIRNHGNFQVFNTVPFTIEARVVNEQTPVYNTILRATGPLTIAQGGAEGGRFQVDSGAVLRFDPGPLFVSSLRGEGIIRTSGLEGIVVDSSIPSGTIDSVTLQDSSVYSHLWASLTLLYDATYEKLQGRTYTHGASFDIYGTLLWRGGGFQLSNNSPLDQDSTGSLIVKQGGTLVLTDTATKELRGSSPLLNHGVIRWESGHLRVYGRLENDSLLRIVFSSSQDDWGILGPPSVGEGWLINRGEIRKEGPGAWLLASNVRYRNEGLIWCQEGEMTFEGAGRHTTAAEIRTQQGTLWLSGADTLNGARIAGAGNSTGEVILNSGLYVQNYAIVDTSGKILLVGPGIVRGDTLFVDGKMIWRRGTLGALTYIRPRGTLSLQGDSLRSLVNILQVQGKMIHTGGIVELSTNTSRLVVSGDSGLVALRDSGVAFDGGLYEEGKIVLNAGGRIHVDTLLTARVLQGETTHVSIHVPIVSHNGRIGASPSGVELLLEGGAGSYADFTTILPGQGRVVFASPSSRPDTLKGVVVAANAFASVRGLVYLPSGGGFFPTNLTVRGTFTLETGRIEGQGETKVDSGGIFNWDGGTIHGDQTLSVFGEFRVWGKNLFLENNAKVIIGDLLHPGQFEVKDTASLLLLRSTIIINTAGDLRIAGAIALSDSSVIENNGTLHFIGEDPSIVGEAFWSAPSYLLHYGVIEVSVVDTAGTYDVVIESNGAEWRFLSGLYIIALGPLVSSYRQTLFNLQSGDLFLLGEIHTLYSGTEFTRSSSPRKEINPGIRTQGRARLNGKIEIAGEVTVDTGVTVVLEGGNLLLPQDSSYFIVQGTFQWNGGNIKANGLFDILRVSPSGLFHILLQPTYTNYMDTLAAPFFNQGTVLWDSASSEGLVQRSFLIFNDTSGTLIIRANTILDARQLFQNFAAIINRGQLVFDVNGGFTLTGDWPLAIQNSGTLNLLRGDVTLYGNLVQTDGLTHLNAGTGLYFPSDSFLLRGGALVGDGSLNGTAVVTGGVVSPGLSPGTLTIGPTYRQDSVGTLEIELGSSAYDKVNLGPNTTLGGQLDVSFSGGFTPSGGERFPILQYPAGDLPQGDFATKNFPFLPPNQQFRTAKTDTAYLLKIISAPVAEMDLVDLDEDQDTLLNLKSNDSDPDGDSIFITELILAGTQGTAILQPDERVAYTPPQNFFGQDSFRYILQDTTNMADTGLVLITVYPVNDTPEVSFAPILWMLILNEDDSATLDLDDYVEDPDNPDNELTWSIGPAARNKRTSSLDRMKPTLPKGRTFRRNKPDLLDPPNTLIPTKHENPPNTIHTTNSSDRIRLNGLNISVDPTTHVATFWGDPDYNNPNGITVTFTATDPEGASGSDDLLVIIQPVPDPPVAMDDQATTDEDTPVTIPILANDYDVDGDPITLVGVNTNGTQGDVQVNPDQTVTYTPPPDFHGQDQFSYTITDGQLTDDALVIINVLPVNDPPVAQDDSVTTDEDTPVTIPVLANDTDADNDPLTVIGLILTGTLGSAVIDPGGQTVTYTPAPDSTRPDHFGYIVSDGQASDTGWVTVTINPINDPPVVSGMPDIVFKEDSSATLALDPYVNDPDNTPDEMTWTVEVLGMSVRVEPAQFLPSFGKLQKPSPRILPRLFHLLQDSLTVVIDPVTRVATFWGTPNWYADSIPVVFTATDPEGASDSDTLLVTILPVNDPPTNFVRLWPEDGDTILGDSTLRLIWSSSKDTVEGDSVWYLLRVVIEGTWRDTLVDTTVTVGDTLVEWAMDSVMLTGIWRIGWDVWATDSIDTVEAENGHGMFYWAVTGVEERTQDHQRVRIIGGYPNPFVREVVYVITGDGPKRIQVDVYDVVGRRVWTWDGEAEGRTVVRWDGRDALGHKVAEGIYLMRIRVASENASLEKTFLLIKML